MKLLGIDYGKKRIGLAISDDSGRLAFPHAVLDNDAKLAENIAEIVSKENIAEIVIGESKNYQMKDNEIMEEARNFAREISDKTGLQVRFQPEFMSSMQVSKEIHHAKSPREQKIRGEKSTSVDAQAATLILQSYIDLQK